MSETKSSNDCAKLLKTLAEPKRLSILRLLFTEAHCVQDIEKALSLPQYEVSRHLGVLRRAGLVEARRDAQRTYYQVHPNVRLEGEILEFGCCRVDFKASEATKSAQG
jgi:DNA-binding transcriptional ArsR family regulator